MISFSMVSTSRSVQASLKLGILCRRDSLSEVFFERRAFLELIFRVEDLLVDFMHDALRAIATAPGGSHALNHPRTSGLPGHPIDACHRHFGVLPFRALGALSDLFKDGAAPSELGAVTTLFSMP